MVLIAELAGRRNSQPGVENEDSTELNVARKKASNLRLRKYICFHFLRGFLFMVGTLISGPREEQPRHSM